LGVLVALAALGAAAASVRGVDVARTEKARTAAGLATRQEVTRAEEALQAHVRLLEPRVSAAAARSELKAMLLEARAQDDAEALLGTIGDGFRTEAWWEPYRREFDATGLSLGSRAGGVPGRLDVVIPEPPLPFEATALLARARDVGLSSGIVRAEGQVFAAAAERIPVPGLAESPVLMLASRLDDRAMEAVARKAGEAVLLSDGKAPLARGGGAMRTDRLATLVGQEASDTPTIAPDGTWAAARVTIARGVFLWVHASAEQSAAAAATTATTTKAAIWGGAALIALISLWLGLRRASPLGAAGPGTTGQAPVGSAAAVMAPRTAPGLGVQEPDASQTNPRAAAAPSPFAATAAFQGAPAPRPSNVFGRYTLVEPLGEGGMARVFTAVTFGAEGFRRKFVVKRLRPELSQEAAVVAQFIDEAKLASSLVHSNVVPVFDFGRVEDEYFMATEYILGRDLGKVVERLREKPAGGPTVMPVPGLLLATAETLKALDYAHGRRGDDGRPLGIVHRDVSPSNVLVSARGEVKLFDFGIVKAEGRTTKTEQGVVKGNVSFMSPEQARGLDTDPRSDLFSLGLVIFYCATGETLYKGATAYEMLMKAATGVGAPERARIAALPAPLPALLARALASDPAARFASAAAFAAALAPHVTARTADLEALMERLFGPDFVAEEARFTSAFPTGTSPGSVPSGVAPSSRNTKVGGS
jgi:serine/threonine protein kinase